MGRISLQKNNKNAGKRAVGVGNILAGVVAITIMGTGLIMSGCGFQRVAEAAATDTPVATQTVNPTTTPTLKPTETPTPKPSPTNTPMPELTEEQKELLLGINKPNDDFVLGNISVYNCTLNSKKYRFWCYRKENTEKEAGLQNRYVVDVFNVFNNEYLFTLDMPRPSENEQGIPITMFKEYLSSTSESLNGLTIEFSDALADVAAIYQAWGVEYNNNETLNGWANTTRHTTIEEAKKLITTPISQKQLLELYLDTTPQEEIPPFWMYIEGATIPDELKGIYTTPTVEPTAFREGNASVRYLTGEIDLDTEMENKTKRM